MREQRGRSTVDLGPGRRGACRRTRAPATSTRYDFAHRARAPARAPEHGRRGAAAVGLARPRRVRAPRSRPRVPLRAADRRRRGARGARRPRRLRADRPARRPGRVRALARRRAATGTSTSCCVGRGGASRGSSTAPPAGCCSSVAILKPRVRGRRARTTRLSRYARGRQPLPARTTSRTRRDPRGGLAPAALLAAALRRRALPRTCARPSTTATAGCRARLGRPVDVHPSAHRIRVAFR